MTDSKVDVAQHRQQAAATRSPDPADKPDSPTDLHSQTWKFGIKRTLKEFKDDQCTDLAAALTYYSVLSLFPALLAVVSVLGLVGQGSAATSTLIDVVGQLAPGSAAETTRNVLNTLASSGVAGFGLVIGLLSALWSASAYVGAFGRAMNRIYEIREGRPFWKLRPLQMLITLLAVVMISVVAVALVVSGPLAEALGNALGIGSVAVTIWQFAKFPVLAVIVLAITAVLYYATPNVKQPTFKWVSPGALVALVVWVVASMAFALYVANFGSYDKTYGALAGVIVFLLWLWLTNLALLFGAEFNSEIERGRELQAGLAAEDELQLPPRDTRNITKKEQKEQEDREEAQSIRSGAR